MPTISRRRPSRSKNLVAGVEMTNRELLNVFERHGITRLDPKGEKFDPHFHQAMFEVPTNEDPPGTVVQVMQAGFKIGERVLRPALVGVVFHSAVRQQLTELLHERLVFLQDGGDDRLFDLPHLAIGAGDDGGAARLAGEQRHLAAVIAGVQRGDEGFVIAVWTKTSASPSSRMNIDSPAAPCSMIFSPRPKRSSRALRSILSTCASSSSWRKGCLRTEARAVLQ